MADTENAGDVEMEREDPGPMMCTFWEVSVIWKVFFVGLIKEISWF